MPARRDDATAQAIERVENDCLEAHLFIDQRPTVAPQQTHTVSPRLIESLSILHLSSLELEQAVSVELADGCAATAVGAS